MANFAGSPVAQFARDGARNCSNTAWTALVSSGTTSLAGRLWVRIQVKGRNALALGYAQINADGTFTAPTDDTRNHTVIPAGAIQVEPLGDRTMLYGRGVPKAGSTNSSVKVIVTEYN